MGVVPLQAGTPGRPGARLEVKQGRHDGGGPHLAPIALDDEHPAAPRCSRQQSNSTSHRVQAVCHAHRFLHCLCRRAGPGF